MKLLLIFLVIGLMFYCSETSGSKLKGGGAQSPVEILTIITTLIGGGVGAYFLYFREKKCKGFTACPEDSSVNEDATCKDIGCDIDTCCEPIDKQKNTCKCPNGTAKSGSKCTKDGASMCDKCNSGYTLNSDETQCLKLQSCKCPKGGTPMDGKRCTSEKPTMCKKCNPGFRINSDGTQCLQNTCKCDNGQPASGPECTKDGDHKCNRCDREFILKSNKCEKRGTCKKCPLSTPYRILGVNKCADVKCTVKECCQKTEPLPKTCRDWVLSERFRKRSKAEKEDCRGINWDNIYEKCYLINPPYDEYTCIDRCCFH